MKPSLLLTEANRLISGGSYTHALSYLALVAVLMAYNVAKAKFGEKYIDAELV